MTRGGRDGQRKYGAVGVQISLNWCPGKFLLLVAGRVSRVVVKTIFRRLSVLQWEDCQDERIHGFFARIAHCRLHGNNASPLHVQGDLANRKFALHGDGAVKVCAAIPFEPFTGRQPHRKLRELRILCHWLRHRISKDAIAKHIFIFRFVGLRRVRPVIVERMQQRQTGVVCFPGLRVDVGLQGIATCERLTHQIRVRFGVGPDTPLCVGILRRVSSQDRTETSPLDPAQIEFRFDGAGHVAADVVAPIRVAHVGSRGREIRLECERIPHRNSVAGKSDLVAVISQAAPAVEEQRAFALALLVGEEDIVDPPCGVQSSDAGGVLLLPVEPEEIDSLLLQRVNYVVQVIGREFLFRDVVGNVLLGRRIDPHGASQLRIVVLPRLHAGGRVDIQCGLEALLVYAL